MQVTIASQAFNGYELFAIQCRQKLDAGIDGAHREFVTITIEFGKHDRARTAVSLGAALLGAGSAEIFTQELQHRTRRVDVLEFDDFAIENKPDRVGLQVDLSYPDRLSSSTAIPVAGRDTSAQLALRSE